MKINEVEAQVGITKKNIRFYEEQGLLSPRRNADNGYREYGDEEVQILRRIKLLRKLGVPIEEIRRIIGADSLGYLKVERLEQMVGGMSICKGCFTGEYPIDPPKEDIRGEFER